jgi:hypothetical protein
MEPPGMTNQGSGQLSQNESPERSSGAVTVLAFTAAALLPLLFWSSGFYSFSADESGHTVDAYHWMKGMRLSDDVWLPLFNIIDGTILRVFPDLFIIPRVISLIFGIAALAGLILLADELFHDRRITGLTALLGALLPQRLLLSIVPLTEIQFMALVVAGCYFFARWVRTRSIADLLAASVWFAAATSSRYEGWVFAGVFAVAVVLLSGDKAAGRRVWSVAIASIALVFPAVWLAAGILHPLESGGFLSAPRDNYEIIFGNSFGGIFLHSLPAQYVLQNALSCNILGLAGLVIAWRSLPDTRRWILVPGGAFFVMSLLSLTGWALPNHSFWRVAAVWSVLTVPFTASLIVGQARRFPRLAVGIIVLILLMCTGEALIMSGRPDFSKDEKNAGEFLGRELAKADPKSMVLVESGSWQYLHLMVASGMPDRFLSNTGDNPSYPSAAIADESHPASPDALQRNNVCWIAARTDGWKAVLSADTLVQHRSDFGRWSVFTLQHIPR